MGYTRLACVLKSELRNYTLTRRTASLPTRRFSGRSTPNSYVESSNMHGDQNHG